jgi:hypothetical protein
LIAVVGAHPFKSLKHEVNNIAGYDGNGGIECRISAERCNMHPPTIAAPGIPIAARAAVQAGHIHVDAMGKHGGRIMKPPDSQIAPGGPLDTDVGDPRRQVKSRASINPVGHYSGNDHEYHYQQQEPDPSFH